MSKSQTLFEMRNAYELISGAEFSPCRRYRYVLWRQWGEGTTVIFVGLNPSTADESSDDPTIRRCVKFAKDWGHSRLVMLNAYAYRATDPKEMQAQIDPVGPDNDTALARWSTEASMVIVAYGSHCSIARERDVLSAIGRVVHCLGVTKYGKPRHPLYIRSNQLPVAYSVAGSK